MSDVKVTFVHSGDWIGLYVDDDLKEEGHSIPECEVARILINSIPLDGVELESRWDWNWEKDAGRLPKRLGDVSWE